MVRNCANGRRGNSRPLCRSRALVEAGRQHRSRRSMSTPKSRPSRRQKKACAPRRPRWPVRPLHSLRGKIGVPDRSYCGILTLSRQPRISSACANDVAPTATLAALDNSLRPAAWGEDVLRRKFWTPRPGGKNLQSRSARANGKTYPVIEKS